MFGGGSRFHRVEWIRKLLYSWTSTLAIDKVHTVFVASGFDGVTEYRLTAILLQNERWMDDREQHYRHSRISLNLCLQAESHIPCSRPPQPRKPPVSPVSL